ncbi:MAG: hypothetical protein FHOMOCKG_00007 [Methanophagales virus GBV302]|uniref:Phosphate transport regulator n=1 Tax=Methanophagales virus GBV302 TaxID=2999281 RepID=A0A9E9A8G4_9CAUD|nr:MAG: hypothetical protein QIT37_gp007 [Methanophagales virus GBV302]WAE39535.1 MAG: hypothetical protein FHOMOCKG_00007 [Methanophagales virus GBV302]
MERIKIIKMKTLNEILEQIRRVLSHALPRTQKYFSDFEKLASLAVKSVDNLKHLGENEHPSTTNVRAKTLEVEADVIVHDIIRSLLYDHTRVTEEKEDIRNFLQNLDDIIDSIEAVVWRITNFDCNPRALQLRDSFIQYIEKAIIDTYYAVTLLPDVIHNQKQLSSFIESINKCEIRGDELYRKWFTSITNGVFKSEGERILLLDILKRLENVLDSAEDVADNLETFLLKGGV